MFLGDFPDFLESGISKNLSWESGFGATSASPTKNGSY
jgi:hypothetical protein